jgi:hypothetical protein
MARNCIPGASLQKNVLVFYNTLYAFCPLGRHIIQGLLHKALAHKIIERTQSIVHSLTL